MAAEAEADLRRALRDNEIVPYFQPLVDLRTGRIAGFEVLARWLHPVRRIVHPTEFIPLAEATGLIGILTEQVLHQACVAASDWPGEIQLAVNVSPLQLHDRAFPERLHHVVEQVGFGPERLVFEITEAAVVRDFDVARAILGNLKALGAQLALDDFGTGYSSLRHVQMLPFDKLKIDASFVRTMTTQRESRKIVAAVVGLCHTLGIVSVAEGIEHQGQADMLRCLGCDLGQGWLFGRPGTAEQASALLRDMQPPPPPIARIAEDVAVRLEALPSQCLAQLQALYDGAPVGLGFLTTDLRYVALNERLAEMHRQPVAAHIGRTVAEVIPELFPNLEPMLRRALGGAVVTDFQTHRPHPDDENEHVFLASYQPVRDVAGEVIGVSVAVVDATSHGMTAAPARPAGGAEPGADNSGLTPRQQDVLRLLADGQSVKQIARRLGLSVGTVKTHLARLYAALGVRNRVEAVMRLGQTGLAAPGRQRRIAGPGT